MTSLCHSTLFSLGTKCEINNTSILNIEGYYKLFKDLPIFESGKRDETEFSNLFYASEGYSFGFELSAEKRNGIVNGRISYSFGASIIKENDTVVYFPRWDKRHAISFVGNIDWRGKYGLIKDKKFELTSSISA